jgi:ArsR family transcriptional regulator
MHSTGVFKLLADPTRLRLLRVLSHDRFNVGELTSILGVAQSGVSRHLGLLKEANLVTEERVSGFVFYRLPDASRVEPRLPLWSLLAEQFAASASDKSVREDESRLQEVLRNRQEQFLPHGDTRQLLPGRSWAAWARTLGELLPALDVVDIGCGDGYLAVEAARWARHVTGVDRSDDVLEHAKALATKRQVTNVEWRKGDLSRLPLRDASHDVALLSQSLHHASDPERAIAEAVRVLRPSGRLLLMDLKAHDQSWVRSRFGDRHLGFSVDELRELLEGAGLEHVRVSTGASRRGDPFTVLIASGTKPAHAARGPVAVRGSHSSRYRAARS